MNDLQKQEERLKKEQLQDLIADLTLPMNKNTTGFRIWIGFLLLLILAGTIMYARQLMTGLGTTAMRDIASWGLYIADFVFLIAVSLVGSLISAILKLLKIKWATPLTRIAEIIAAGALITAMLVIVIDMGRPDRLWHIFVYGRVQSPIVWDILVISTYLVISILLLYLPLVPDIALLYKNSASRPAWQQRIYKILSLGWQGTDDQRKILKKTVFALMVLTIPVAFAIHTVTSWLFASTPRAGWDSTVFGPYFVAGAFMVGAASVIVIMYVLRKEYNLKQYITDHHFDMMGKLLVLTSLLYLYFNLNEFLVPAYKMEAGESPYLLEIFKGDYALLFWGVQILGMVIPILLLLFGPLRKPGPVAVISVFVIIGAFLKRFLIITPTLLNPFLPIQNYPESYHHYIPTLSESIITLASIAGVALVISLFIKAFPILPVCEIAHEKGIDNEIINN